MGKEIFGLGGDAATATQYMAIMLQPAFWSAMSWLQQPKGIRVLLTARSESFVHDLAVRLGDDGSVDAHEGAPVTKMFDGSMPPEFVKITFTWSKSVHIDLVRKAVRVQDGRVYHGSKHTTPQHSRRCVRLSWRWITCT